MKKLLKRASAKADFVQKFEIGAFDSEDEISISVFDRFDPDIKLEACSFQKIDEKTIEVYIPAWRVAAFSSNFMYLSIIAVQGGRVTNPINCEVELI